MKLNLRYLIILLLIITLQINCNDKSKSVDNEVENINELYDEIVKYRKQNKDLNTMNSVVYFNNISRYVLSSTDTMKLKEVYNLAISGFSEVHKPKLAIDYAIKYTKKFPDDKKELFNKYVFIANEYDNLGEKENSKLYYNNILKDFKDIDSSFRVSIENRLKTIDMTDEELIKQFEENNFANDKIK